MTTMTPEQEELVGARYALRVMREDRFKSNGIYAQLTPATWRAVEQDAIRRWRKAMQTNGLPLCKRCKGERGDETLCGSLCETCLDELLDSSREAAYAEAGR